MENKKILSKLDNVTYKSIFKQLLHGSVTSMIDCNSPCWGQLLFFEAPDESNEYHLYIQNAPCYELFKDDCNLDTCSSLGTGKKYKRLGYCISDEEWKKHIHDVEYLICWQDDTNFIKKYGNNHIIKFGGEYWEYEDDVDMKKLSDIRYKSDKHDLRTTDPTYYPGSGYYFGCGSAYYSGYRANSGSAFCYIPVVANLDDLKAISLGLNPEEVRNERKRQEYKKLEEAKKLKEKELNRENLISAYEKKYDCSTRARGSFKKLDER